MKINLGVKARARQRKTHLALITQEETCDADQAFTLQINATCSAITRELDFLREQTLRFALKTDLKNIQPWQSLSYIRNALEEIHKTLVQYHDVKDVDILDEKE